MSETLVNVAILLNGDEIVFRLNEDIVVDGQLIPRGFVSDGISSPPLVWMLFPQVDIYIKEAFFHDYLLHIGIDWKEAERRFKRALKSRGLSRTKIFFIVNAVRLNGLIKGKRK